MGFGDLALISRRMSRCIVVSQKGDYRGLSWGKSLRFCSERALPGVVQAFVVSLQWAEEPP